MKAIAGIECYHDRLVSMDSVGTLTRSRCRLLMVGLVLGFAARGFFVPMASVLSSDTTGAWLEAGLHRIEALEHSEPLQDIARTVAPSSSTDTGTCEAVEPVIRSKPPQNRNISEFLEGTGLTDTSGDYAACEFRPYQYSKHFPHTMQQLYRCLSWWMSNPGKQPVLVGGSRDIRERGSAISVGFLRALDDVFNVSLVEGWNASSVHALDLFGYDFALPQHAANLRRAVVDHYHLNNQNFAGCKDSTIALPSVRIVDRQSSRNLKNVDALLREIRNRVGVRADVVYFEEMTFLEQVKAMNAADIVISPHGGQLVSLPFMPTCGAVLEIFPKGLFIPEFFGSLAVASGLNHSVLYQGPNRTGDIEVGMKNVRKRRQIRRRPVCVDIAKVVSFVLERIGEWRQCCRDLQNVQ